MIVLAALVLVVLLLLARRRHRKATLSGLNSTRPVFSVEPPHRRQHRLSKEAL